MDRPGRLVQIVGVQPLPTLLAFRQLRPKEVLLVSGRGLMGSARRLAPLIAADAEVHTTELNEPFDPLHSGQALRQRLANLGWGLDGLTFDLSGAIKSLSLAAFGVARAAAADLVDVEPGRGGFVLRRYAFEDDHAVARAVEPLPALISLADHLSAHWGGFVAEGFHKDGRGRSDAGSDFEVALYRALQGQVDEILAGVRPASLSNQVEIDLVVRLGNQVGIVEAKTGVNKAGLDQLDTAGDWLNMGVYTDKFLVTGGRFPAPLRRLASASRIVVVELPNYRAGRPLSRDDAERLGRTVRLALEDTTRLG
jgi:hypothetical protein